MFASLCTCVALLFPTPTNNDEPKPDGTWICIKAEREGQAFDEPLDSKVVFADGKITIHDKKSDKSHKGTYKFDPKLSPAHITLIPDPDEGEDAKELLCIYQIKGDELTLCISRDMGERPTEFVTKPESKFMLLVLKREKS